MLLINHSKTEELSWRCGATPVLHHWAMCQHWFGNEFFFFFVSLHCLFKWLCFKILQLNSLTSVLENICNCCHCVHHSSTYVNFLNTCRKPNSETYLGPLWLPLECEHDESGSLSEWVRDLHKTWFDIHWGQDSENSCLPLCWLVTVLPVPAAKIHQSVISLSSDRAGTSWEEEQAGWRERDGHLRHLDGTKENREERRSTCVSV